MPHPTFQTVRDFVHRARHLTLVVCARAHGDAPPVLQRVQLHDAVADAFREIALGALEADGEVLVISPYDPGYKPEPHEWLTLPIAESEAVATTLAGLQPVDDMEIFRAEDEVIDRLSFYALVIGGTGGRQAVFLRTYSPRKELTRRRGFALWLQRGSYNRVEDKVFLFDPDVDCFAWDGVLYIRHVASFERIFDYYEELRLAADATVRRIHRRVPIANFEEFRDACTRQPQMLTKLASISRKPYLNTVGPADVRRAIREFNLPIETQLDGDGEMLVFDSSRETRWLILKLLDDSYLGSVMTREKYEVNSKRPV